MRLGGNNAFLQVFDQDTWTYSYLLADEVTPDAGDTLLVVSSGRTGFQAGDASVFYRSVNEAIFSLPKSTRIHPGRDYRGR